MSETKSIIEEPHATLEPETETPQEPQYVESVVVEEEVEINKIVPGRVEVEMVENEMVEIVEEIEIKEVVPGRVEQKKSSRKWKMSKSKSRSKEQNKIKRDKKERRKKGKKQQATTYDPNPVQADEDQEEPPRCCSM